MPDKPLAYDAYEELAGAYAAHVETKPTNAYYERPATLSLLPDVRCLKVLDAGCGPGVNSEWLVEHGASVVALDASPAMIALTQERLGNRVEAQVCDFGRPMPQFETGQFDLILSALAIHYVEDQASMFREFARVLKPGGCFVFSTCHPAQEADFYQSTRYFEVEKVGCEWKGFGEKRVFMPSYRRSLMDQLNPLIEAGFMLEKFIEPLPTEEFRSIDPAGYAEFMRRPAFLCVRGKKSS